MAAFRTGGEALRRPGGSLETLCELSRFLVLRSDRYSAGSAARATHGDQDFLLLLFVEICVLEHTCHLFGEKIMQRQITCFDLMSAGRRRRFTKRIRRRRGQIGSCCCALAAA